MNHQTAKSTTYSLNQLPIGAHGSVQGLRDTCSGLQRRRLLDLGILPGTQIAAEFSSPNGDPRAYRVRGTLIALRNEHAAQIILHTPEESPDESA